MSVADHAKKSWRAACFLLFHFLKSAMFVGAFVCLHYILLAVGDPKLFGLFPLRYVFDGADLIVLLIYLLEGIPHARRIFQA